MSSKNGKFCPACKMKNEASATTCAYCGVPFEVVIPSPKITKTRNPTVDLHPAVENEAGFDLYVKVIPENGIAIYRANFIYPFAVRQGPDFVIGRKSEQAAGELLDLDPLEGYIMGVSKQHVRIQAEGDGYLITDLGSTNGTWINDVRLNAYQPAKLPNAARVRMGRLELYFVYKIKTT